MESSDGVHVVGNNLIMFLCADDEELVQFESPLSTQFYAYMYFCVAPIESTQVQFKYVYVSHQVSVDGSSR